MSSFFRRYVVACSSSQTSEPNLGGCGPNSAAMMVLGSASLGIGRLQHDSASGAVPGPLPRQRTAHRGRAAATTAWAVQHFNVAQLLTASAEIDPPRGAASSLRRRQVPPRRAGPLTSTDGSHRSGTVTGLPPCSDPRVQPRRARTLSGISANELPSCSDPRVIFTPE